MSEPQDTNEAAGGRSDSTAVLAPETEIEVLRNDLDTALCMLADWCVAVDENGTGWDDWDEYYKDAMYREGPLRAQLDKAIAEARERSG